MNLLHPTLGDLIDRASVLRLKAAGTVGFSEELLELETEIAKRQPNLRVFTLARELEVVHQRIWHINERLAATSRLFIPRANTLGLQAWKLNQDRIKLVEAIDREVGEFVRPEKLYR